MSGRIHVADLTTMWVQRHQIANKLSITIVCCNSSTSFCSSVTLVRYVSRSWRSRHYKDNNRTAIVLQYMHAVSEEAHSEKKVQRKHIPILFVQNAPLSQSMNAKHMLAYTRTVPSLAENNNVALGCFRARNPRNSGSNPGDWHELHQDTNLQ